MEYLKQKENTINITFIYNSVYVTKKTPKRNDIFGNVLKDYASEIGVDLKSIYFLYGGNKIEDSQLKLKLDDIIKKDSIENNNNMIILVFSIETNMISQQNSNINKNRIQITFILNSSETHKLEASWEDIIKKYLNMLKKSI